MTRSRFAGFAVLMLVAAVALAWCLADAPDADGKAGPKTPAELLIGTWTSTGYDNFKQAWWHSERLQFRPDKTWVFSSNDKWYLFRQEGSRGTYEVVGDTLRSTGLEAPDSDERVAAGIGPHAPLLPRTWLQQIATLDGEVLILVSERIKPDPPRRDNYRRVR